MAVIIVVITGGGLLASVINGSAAAAVQVDPRFSAPELVVEPRGRTQFSGQGEKRIPVDGTSPVLLEFSSSHPVELLVDGEPVVDSSATSGQVLIDRGDGDGKGTDGDVQIDIATHGKWTVNVLPVDRAMFWEALSPVAGDGPRVLLFPGGLTHTVLVDVRDANHVELRAVGRCRVNRCPALTSTSNGDVVVPAGTEALIVDSSGSWKLVPDALADSEQAQLLADTKLR